MKKIFTLLFVLGMFALAQAQPGSRDNRQGDQRDHNNGYDNSHEVVVNNQPWYKDDIRYDDRFSLERKRDMEISRINRDYDFKIQRVRSNFFIGRFEKDRQTRFLQEQREREIRMVYAKFTEYRHRYDDHPGRRY